MLRRTCSGSLYDLLNVERDATTRDIRKAYHLLALNLHPDKTGGKTTEEFKKVLEAHTILTDPQLRRTYDMFGKKGVDTFNQYGISMELLSLGFLRMCFISLTLYAALILLALELVVVRQDFGMKWSWPVTFTPIWISFLPLLLASGVLFYKGFEQCRVNVLIVACELVLFMTAVAVGVAALAGRVEPIVSIASFAVVYFVDTLRTGRFLIPSQFSQLGLGHTEMESVCGSRLYWGFFLKTVFEKLCVFLFLGLGMHRAQQKSEKESKLFSFWLVFSPLIVYFGVMSIISASIGFFEKHPVTHEMPALSIRICRSVFAALSNGSFLYISCMLAAKCNVELNNAHGGFHPSLSVALIPLQVLFALLVLIPCSMSCFAKSLLDAVVSEAGAMGEGFPNGGEDWGGRETEASPSRIIVPSEPALRGEYQEI